MAFVSSGKLNRRVTIQRATEAADSVGELIATWADLGTYWASVTPLNGTESVIAAQLRADVDYEIRMRYVRSDITPKDRITYDGRTLNIVSVKNSDESRTQLVILAKQAGV